MATFTRSTSGLLEARDDFGSDTSANYNGRSGNTLTITGGSATATANSWWARKTFNTVGVVSCKTQRLAGNRVSGVLLLDRDTVDAAADCDGYRLSGSSSSIWGVYEVTNDTLGTSGTSSNDYPASSGNPGLIRGWRDGTNAYMRVGTTTYGTLITFANTAHATLGYAGLYFANEASPVLDWVEYRTSVNATCTGLPTGWWLYATDGTAHAHIAASSGTATLPIDALLWPLTEVSLYDGDPDGAGVHQEHILAATVADMGGGDAFVYSLGPTINASQVASDIVVTWT